MNHVYANDEEQASIFGFLPFRPFVHNNVDLLHVLWLREIRLLFR